MDANEEKAGARGDLDSFENHRALEDDFTDEDTDEDTDEEEVDNDDETVDAV